MILLCTCEPQEAALFSSMFFFGAARREAGGGESDTCRPGVEAQARTVFSFLRCIEIFLGILWHYHEWNASCCVFVLPERAAKIWLLFYIPATFEFLLFQCWPPPLQINRWSHILSISHCMARLWSDQCICSMQWHCRHSLISPGVLQQDAGAIRGQYWRLQRAATELQHLHLIAGCIRKIHQSHHTEYLYKELSKPYLESEHFAVYRNRDTTLGTFPFSVLCRKLRLPGAVSQWSIACEEPSLKYRHTCSLWMICGV